MKTILEIEHPEGSRIILSSIGYAKDGRDYFGAAKAKIIESSRPVEPNASGHLAKCTHGIDVWARCFECELTDQQKIISNLRKQNASLQSHLDVMQQDRDDWRARAEHFVKLASQATKAVDMMRPFQVKGEI